MNEAAPPPRFFAVADHAVLVDFAADDEGTRDDVTEQAANLAVVALDHVLEGAAVHGVREVVPALVSLLIEFDPVETDHVAVESAARDAWATASDVQRMPSIHRVPVCFDASVAPDLEAVAIASGLSVDAVIAAHLAGDYRVLMYGFAPGYAYLGGVPDTIRVPRKPTPVRGVVAGSVIIAGPQCLVTTITMPTGWSIIGSSPTRVITDDPDSPFLFVAGDHIEFERIDLAALDHPTAAL